MDKIINKIILIYQPRK